MYRIFTKHNDKLGTWKLYGTVSGTTATDSTITPFETEDIDELRAEILKLNAEIGHENIMACKMVDLSYGVTVVDDEE